MPSRSLSFLLAAGALAACGEPSDAVVAQCVEQCDAASDCPSSTGGCLDICEEERRFSTHIECKSEYETMLDCLDTAKDVCDQFGECPVEVSVYFTCFGDFCVANPGDAECGEVEQGGGSS